MTLGELSEALNAALTAFPGSRGYVVEGVAEYGHVQFPIREVEINTSHRTVWLSED